MTRVWTPKPRHLGPVEGALCHSRGDHLRILLLPYLLLVGIHLISGLQMEQPIIMADELGYLGNARYLAGAAPLPDMRGTQFYHFGYSLLLLPLFWLFTDPASLYQAALTINALVMSALYFPLASILTDFLEVPRRAALGIAFVCCLYPPLILYSNFAWSENAFVPALAMTALLFGRLLQSRSARDAMLFGLAAGLLYTIHPRGLPVVAVALIYLLVLAALRVLPGRRVLLGVTALGLILGLTAILNEHLEALGWVGKGGISAIRLVGRILPGSRLTGLLLRAAGQSLYLSLATSGLALLGLLSAAGFLRKRMATGPLRRVLAEPRTGLLIFVMSAGAGLVLGSSALKIHSLYSVNTIRATNLIYGRYNEAIAVLLMAFGLQWLWRDRRQLPQIAWRALAAVAIILGLAALVELEISAASQAVSAETTWNVNAVDVAGVFPLIDQLGIQNIYRISLAALAALLAILVTMRASRRAGTALLALLFAGCSIYNARFYVRPAVEVNRSRLAFVERASDLGPIEAISYDLASRNRDIFYGSQYRLPQTIFDQFDSRQDQEPSAQVVLSDNRWSQAVRLRARFLVSAVGGDAAIWLLPGELESSLAPPSYREVTLGIEPRLGVQESGFYTPEWFDGELARWTDGAATLRVPVDPRSPPRWLEIETVATGRLGDRLQVLANGVELWNDWISQSWQTVLDLVGVPPEPVLVIELNSGPPAPRQNVDDSTETRSLGVMVRVIRLGMLEDRTTASFEGVTLGVESVSGLRETGFHPTERFDDALGRWTNGAATLTIPLDPEKVPRSLEIEVAAPGRTATRLQLLANGFELCNETISDEGWSKVFSLEPVPLADELLLEIKSDTITPAEFLEGSTDPRTLGVVVKGIRLPPPDNGTMRP